MQYKKTSFLNSFEVVSLLFICPSKNKNPGVHKYQIHEPNHSVNPHNLNVSFYLLLIKIPNVKIRSVQAL